MAQLHPLERLAFRANYGTKQAARVAWYTGQNIAMRRLTAREAKGLPPAKRQMRKPESPMPDLSTILQSVAELMARDMANVEAGLYPMPREKKDGLPGMIKRARSVFTDMQEVNRRRRDDSHQEVFEEHRETSTLPRYYLQNFHFQSDGWLSEESAGRYDAQVDLLFHGATGAMRRMGLAEITRFAKGKDQRTLKMVDIASGTGAFINDVSVALPRLPLTALDLSEAYLRRSRETRAKLNTSRRQVNYINANAEHLPFANDRVDILSCVYLFHELPPKVRRIVASEISRTLKPGGLFVFIDSLQTDETPPFNALLEIFPEMFHEPYYRGYLNENIQEIFEAAGLTMKLSQTAFLSKVMTFRKV